jgi:uncharacterized membrane protein YdfJ with MMPL/SSD domain
MEPTNDPKLRELLREWQVPNAPGSLDRRVLDLRGADSNKSWWRFLLTGSVRIPVPVGLAIAALLVIMAGALMLRRPTGPAASADSVSLVEFRPVKDVNVRMIRGDEAN